VLADFIATELKEACDGNEYAELREIAILSMYNARDKIEAVIDELTGLLSNAECTTYRVYNIKWDQDSDDDNELPSEVQVTVDDVKLIGDKISDIVGYCHLGFDYEALSNTPRSALLPGS